MPEVHQGSHNPRAIDCRPGEREGDNARGRNGGLRRLTVLLPRGSIAWISGFHLLLPRHDRAVTLCSLPGPTRESPRRRGPRNRDFD